MTQDAWVTSHPYLQPVAVLHAQVRNELTGIAASSEIPPWDDYLRDYLAGVPIL